MLQMLSEDDDMSDWISRFTILPLILGLSKPPVDLVKRVAEKLTKRESVRLNKNA